MSLITEWEFTADVAVYINDILKERPDLPFASAHCEQRGKGNLKRRDLTLKARRNEQIILTGEVKLPDKRDGRSPLQETLVIDAHNKANQIGVEYFFTWNVNNCVLWKTFEQGKPITERHVEFFDALPAPIHNSDELTQPRVKEQVKRFLTHFLERCAAIFSGERPMALLPLDEKFIRVWELDLFPLVRDTRVAINEQYDASKVFHKKLDSWMRDEQGWNLSQTDEEIIRENLERAAKFSCYVLANKVVFYKALRRQFPRLKAMRISKNVETGAELGKLLEAYFSDAKRVTRDYETVFQGSFGDTLPLLNDVAVDSWRALVEDTDKFDFTQINYEVIGQIFEGLLSVEERHKFGQHYTRSEVVDLINAFCIRRPDVKVLDPSCGGGTFLVRAYQRKNDLAKGSLTHQDIIGQIFGFDISAYPVHLTTINLATRDLKEGANYPRVARKDFFKVNSGDKVFNIPSDEGEETDAEVMPKVGAIVGNPPYVRQEKINEYYGGAYKKLLQDMAREDAPGTELSGRSDILCYFFTHGFAFLEEGGYMGLLTSSGWLDTAYGFNLQKFLLDNFEIVAVFESNCEPWFTGARVTTTATILRRQPDAARREANNVKFVWIKQPVARFLDFAHTEGERREVFEEIRRRVENLAADEETEAWRVRVVNQGTLYEVGCLPFAISADEEEDEEEDDTTTAAKTRVPGQIYLPEHQREQTTEYTGYKWGIFLRAPEIFSKLFMHYGESFVPFCNLAEIRRGITSGCDEFFYPRDVTEEALKVSDNKEFIERFGIRRAETKTVRIVHSGKEELKLIEARYLEPEVHSLMEVNSVHFNPRNLARMILLVSEPKEKLKGTHVLNYIKWGEKKGFPKRSTIQSRINTGKLWYDLTTESRGKLFWPKSQQYRHIVPLNSHYLICNCNLYDIYPHKEVNAKLLCAVLNSTIVALSKSQFGRLMGREGNLKTEVVDVNMMLVPDLRQSTPAVRKRLEEAFDSMRKRQALPLVDVDSTETDWTGELALADRQQLDAAVLELLGISDPQERIALRDELYEEITKLYRQIRVAERKMQRHRSATARGGRPTPHSIAEEIWEELDPKPVALNPLDYIPQRARTEEVELPPGKAKIIPQSLWHPDGVQIAQTFLELGDPTRSLYVKELADLELTGTIRVPLDASTCQKALDDYRADRERLNEEFQTLASSYTADETLQIRVVQELWKMTKR